MAQSLFSDGTSDVLEMKRQKDVTFYLFNKLHTVRDKDLTATTSLNSYLRKTLNLTGTKGMCYEGGCGCCSVVIQTTDPITGKKVALSVNSCLMPVLSCNGYEIYTIECIGNALKGFHPVQKVLEKFNGTQCGFCSPGMVVNMYALCQSGQMTMKEIEDAFGGNICRCTGYRPILSAFKSLSTDASPDLLSHVSDIEDLRVCPKEKFVKAGVEDCPQPTKEPFWHLLKDRSKWFKLFTLKDLLLTLKLNKDSKYRLVAGNTGQAMPKYINGETFDIYIDVTSVSELSEHKLDGDCYILGGNITLTKAIEILSQAGKANFRFAYFKKMVKHIQLIANLPVRNRATIAGNLMIKRDLKFASDLFLLFETVKAHITVVNALNGEQIRLSLQDFLTYDMKMKVVLNVVLSSYSNSVELVTYKVMPRAENASAIVNAGFFFKFNQKKNLDAATIVYGNVNNSFVHATATEKFLVDKNLFNNSTLQSAYQSLSKELNPDSRPPAPSSECRKQIAIALFYKAVLSIAPADMVSTRNKSGGTLLQRPISKGTQDYETKKFLYPLTKAISKVEAFAQTSGQAEYIGDMPDLPNQLHGVLILAKAAPNSSIKRINPDEALKVDGVVAFFDKDDIPGDNNFIVISPPFSEKSEEIFCSGKVLYYDQPVGILVGKNEEVVKNAASLIEITYNSPTSRPLLSVRQILREGRTERVEEYQTVLPKRKGVDVKHVIKGKFDGHHQYHFHMETHCCNVVPTEDGLDVYPSSQWMDAIQIAIAKMLKIANSKISVTIRRCGGGFGGKLVKNGLVACAAALAAWKLKQPVKLTLSLTTNMAVIGKRMPLSADYEVEVNDEGVIQYLDTTFYNDQGAVINENIMMPLLDGFIAVYDSDTFKLQLNRVRTDTTTNTWIRAPGLAQSLFAIESIMDHIGWHLNIDPLQVRVANVAKDSPFLKYVKDLKSWAYIDERKQKIAAFNKTNRWKKMGLSVVMMEVNFPTFGPYSVAVSVFHDDGTVQVSHGGVEIGQGINTKAVQVCAYKLGIPVEDIVVKPSNTFVSPNNIATAASKSSEAVCYAIMEACDILLQRIQPYRDQLPSSATWKDIIQSCHKNFVDLTAKGTFAPNKKGVHPYPIYGICASEAMVDVLTGQYIITRTDLIEDVGQSMSPAIDVGQVEGAFVMGMGYHTTEKIQFDQNGQILTKNTWTYHVPGAKDIPADFRVKFPKNNPNPLGVLSSKATGEQALCLASSVGLAIRDAVASARIDAATSNSKWYPIDGPADVESVFMNSLNNFSQYTL